MKINSYSITGVFVGFIASLITLVTLFGLWAVGGFATDIWVDGCPDVVAAHKPSPWWWEKLYVYVIPLILLSLSVYLGVRVNRMMLRLKDGKIHGKN